MHIQSQEGSAKIVVILIALAVVLGGVIVYSTMLKKDIVSSVPPITEGDLARIGFDVDNTQAPFFKTEFRLFDFTGDGVGDAIVVVSQQASGISRLFNAFTRDKSVRDLGCDKTKFYWGKATDEEVQAVLQETRGVCVDLGIKLVDSGVHPFPSIDQLRWSKEEGKFVGAPAVQVESFVSVPAQSVPDWRVYESDYGFQIQYPQDWKVVNELDSKKVSYPTTILLSVAFGTGTYGYEGYDGEWFVFIYDKSSASVEGLIQDMGKQFSDRQEKRERITINGVSALKVVVTTPSIPSWVYEAVVVEQGNRIYYISNGAQQNDLFDEFYGSFRLVSVL
ncbi:MAG: hypothetical protein Q8P01_05495 [bacterium]|nr:hypothetical protein [bacterium]